MSGIELTFTAPVELSTQTPPPPANGNGSFSKVLSETTKSPKVQGVYEGVPPPPPPPSSTTSPNAENLLKLPTLPTPGLGGSDQHLPPLGDLLPPIDGLKP